MVADASVTALRPLHALTLGRSVDDFCDQLANAGTRKVYSSALTLVATTIGPDRLLATVTGDEVGAALEARWGRRSVNTWNLRRATVISWLSWCAQRGDAAPTLPASVKAERTPLLPSRARSAHAIDRLIAGRDVSLREKTLWRMLYETAARTSELLELNVEDLNLAGRTAMVRGKGAGTARRRTYTREHVIMEPIFWDAGTARLLPRLLDGRTKGPVFLTDRRPSPGHARAPRDIDPDSGRARLSYDRASALFQQATAGDDGGRWSLHDLRHSALTHLGEAGASLPLLMAKSRHRKVETIRTYVRPGAAAMGELTALLGPQ